MKYLPALLKIVSTISVVVGIALVRGYLYAGAISFWGALYFGFSWPPIVIISFVAMLLIYWVLWPFLNEEPPL